jgi:hypothetical protein
MRAFADAAPVAGSFAALKRFEAIATALPVEYSEEAALASGGVVTNAATSS